MPQTSYIFIRNVHGHKISKEIIQKSVTASKPKCLNMIAESDNKYIVHHTKINQSSSKHYMFVCLFVCLMVFLVQSTFGPVVAGIVWYLDLQLPMQSVPITTDVVSWNLESVNVIRSLHLDMKIDQQ
jgi:hypothetical protein